MDEKKDLYYKHENGIDKLNGLKVEHVTVDELGDDWNNRIIERAGWMLREDETIVTVDNYLEGIDILDNRGYVVITRDVETGVHNYSITDSLDSNGLFAAPTIDYAGGEKHEIVGKYVIVSVIKGAEPLIRKNRLDVYIVARPLDHDAIVWIGINEWVEMDTSNYEFLDVGYRSLFDSFK